MTGQEDELDALDVALEDPRVAVFGGKVVCQECGEVLTSVAAVGVAAARIEEHLAGHDER